MPTAKIDSINCYYEVHGKGSPLVLIGGLASDSQSWQAVVDHLKQDRQVIVFDNRGVGRTQYPGRSFDIAVLAKDAVMLLDSLGIEKADILGHSMGGYIAQEIAISRPERVNKLILESTAACTSARNKALFTDMAQLLEKGIPYESFLREFMGWLFTPEYFEDKNKVDEFVQFAVNYPYRQTAEGFSRQVKAYIGFNSFDRLDRVQAETLVIAGAKDILITRDETEILAGKIRKATVKYIDRAAHSLHIEAPEELVGAILGL